MIMMLSLLFTFRKVSTCKIIIATIENARKQKPLNKKLTVSLMFVYREKMKEQKKNLYVGKKLSKLNVNAFHFLL